MNTRLQTLHFDNASLLALKLFAFAAMVLDHVDWLLWTGQGAHAGIGRTVFPIFGVLLAYNAARTDPAKILGTIVPRILLIGLVAQVPYGYLTGHWLSLNIMFTLALSLTVYALTEREAGIPTVFLMLVCGAFVDYAWWGVIGVVVTAQMMRHGTEPQAWLSATLFCLLLTFVNGNMVALLALPLLWCASRIRLGNAPRMKWLFWAGYPVHLGLLAIIKWAF